jgi:hypothetical protein
MIQLIKQLENRTTKDYNVTIGALYIAISIVITVLVIGG